MWEEYEQQSLSGQWNDNGDGSSTDEFGDIYDDYTGEWIGTLNDDGSWNDVNGQLYTWDNRPVNDGGFFDNGDGTWTSFYTGETVQGGGTLGEISDGVAQVTIPENWIDNQDGSVTDPTNGDIWGIDGTYLGNTADAGLGGGMVNYDPDEFGDVYTVNGKWVGNIYGLPKPGSSNATSARKPGNTPGGAYSSGNFNPAGGSSSSSNQNKATDAIVKQLAKSSGAPFNQQAALASALNNAKAQSDEMTKYLLPAAIGVLALALFARR